MVLGMGKKRAANHDVENGGQDNDTDRLGKPTTATGRSLLLVSQLLAILGIVVLAVGAGILQYHTNHTRTPAVGTNVGSYNNDLQSAHWTPYPNHHHRQWMMLWWIMFGSFFTWLLTMILVLRSVRVVQWRPALVGLHIYFLALCTFAIDSFLWLEDGLGASPFFGEKRVRTVLAGLFILAGAQGLAVLALGMLANTRHIDSRNIATGRGVQMTQTNNSRVTDVNNTNTSETHNTIMPPMGGREVPASQTQFVGTPGEHPVRVHQGGAYPTGAGGTTGALHSGGAQRVA